MTCANLSKGRKEVGVGSLLLEPNILWAPVRLRPIRFAGSIHDFCDLPPGSVHPARNISHVFDMRDAGHFDAYSIRENVLDCRDE